MNDDWAYLLPARRLAESGALLLTDWAPATQVLHVAWGALAIKLFGFQIGLLKLAMLAWTAAGSAILLFLLLEEGAPEPAAVLASTALALNPIIVLCTMTYMTDVPYLTLELAGLYALCRGLREDDDRWLAAGGTAAAGAFLIRQIGLALPFAAAIELGRLGRLNRRRLAALFAPGLAAATAWYAWSGLVQGPTLGTRFHMARTLHRLADPLSFADAMAARLSESALSLGLFVLPLSAGLAKGAPPSKGAARASGALLLAFVWLVAVHGGFPYGSSSFQKSGLGWVTVPGEPFKTGGVFGFPGLWLAVTIASAAGAWLAVRAAGDAGGRGWSPGLRVIAWAAVLQLIPSIIWSAYFDRYVVPLLPFALALCALAAAKQPFHWRPGAAVLAGFSVLWLLGAADYASWNRAEARLVRRTLAGGVQPARLASGWDWDAFYNYERRTAELKAAKPLQQIDEWAWRDRSDRDLLVTFEPHPETHWRGVELLDRESYETPLSSAPGTLYLFKVATTR
jgi:hypothetical protein